jgi:hypothetical protein
MEQDLTEPCVFRKALEPFQTNKLLRGNTSGVDSGQPLGRKRMEAVMGFT